MTQNNFIDLNEIISTNIPYYAHIEGGGSAESVELLADHTHLCEEYYMKILRLKNIRTVYTNIYNRIFEDSTYEKLFHTLLDNVITFHDIGKTNPQYQRLKMKNSSFEQNDSSLKNNGEHSIYSAFIYLEYFTHLFFKNYDPEGDFAEHKEQKELLKVMFAMAFVISKHHTHLSNFEKNKMTFFDTLISCNKNHDDKKKGIYEELREELSRINALNPNFIENFEIKREYILNVAYGLSDDYYTKDNNSLFLLMRLMYSLLVAADFYATTEYMKNIKTTFNTLEIQGFQDVYNNSVLIKEIRKKEATKSYLKNPTMNDIRTKIFLEVEKEYHHQEDKRIYFLESPTGSGKSNIAMNLSFNMLTDDRKKIIYAYPFNTLVEQNKETLDQLFKETDHEKYIAVVNSIHKIGDEKWDKEPDETNNEEYQTKKKEYYTKLLLDRQFLHAPFVVTSNVNLFKLLFGNKRTDLFGLYQLIDSVIVLDEIQAYKSSIWIEIIEQLQLYAELFNMKIIIMSATLPDLSTFLDSQEMIGKLVKDPEKLFNEPLFKKRVQINYDLLKVPKFDLNTLKNHMKEHLKENKKILVEFIYKKRADEFYDLIYNEFPGYEVILLTSDVNLSDRKQIIEKVKEEDRKVILISTQIIEAGVDIDMDMGYKDISIFENEEQFLGRINRSCKKKNAMAYFFDLDDASVIYRNSTTKYSTLKNDDRKKDLIEKDFKEYYRKKLKSLADNKNSFEGYIKFEKNINALNFKVISKYMELIEDTRLKRNKYFFSRKIKTKEMVLDGNEIWNNYKKLLYDFEMDFSEKKIRLFNLRTDMNYFIYEVDQDIVLPTNDETIGDIMYIEDGERYFKNGKLDLGSEGLFL